MNKILGVIKNNFTACLCFALAAVVALSGSLSYARYAQGVSHGSGATAGSFAYSTSIDAVSALSFTNTAFWGGAIPGEGEDKVAMNALRSIDFSVNNFETPGGKPSEVALKYTLCFSAPANFVEKLAIQLFDEDTGSAMLPQIVMSDLLNTPGGGVFDTADSYAYNGTDAPDLAFNIQASGGTVTATTAAGDVRIRVERGTANLRQTLLFRLWDTSQLHLSEITYESGLLLPPMEAKLNVDVDIYRVSISMDALVLQPGSAATRHHSLRLAPTDILNDDYLGGTLYAQNGNNLTSFGAGGNYLLRTVKEQVTDNGVAGAVHTVFGTPTVYHVGDTITEEITKGAHTEQLATDQPITRTYTTTYGAVREEAGWPASGETYYNNSWTSVPGQNQARYKLTVDANATVSVTETVLVEAGSTVASSTRVYELCTPTSVSDTEISLNVVRVTERTATYSCTVTVTRTYTLTGYTLQRKSGNSWTIYNGTFGANANFPQKTDTKTFSAGNPVTSEERVNISRKIKRTIDEVTFTPDSVTREDDDKNSYNYTSSAPLQLKSGGEQIFYISQCYSKSYPFEIDVVFEQALT